jgi:hypothetical protein
MLSAGVSMGISSLIVILLGTWLMFKLKELKAKKRVLEERERESWKLLQKRMEVRSLKM